MSLLWSRGHPASFIPIYIRHYIAIALAITFLIFSRNATATHGKPDYDEVCSGFDNWVIVEDHRGGSSKKWRPPSFAGEAFKV
jgi:hypothetical protein